MNPTDTINAPTSRSEEKFFLLIVIALALVAGLGSWFAFTAFAAREKVRGQFPDHPRTLVNFAFTNSAGQTVSRADVKGKILVVSFLFTSCSLTCPEVTKRMVDIQKRLAGDPQVRLLSFTVDPHSDTTTALAAWGIKYGINTNSWDLLTGLQEQLHWVISNSFLASETNNPFNSMPGNFAGTDQIAVVDKQGRLRYFFDGLRLETAPTVIATIADLKKEDP